MKTFKLACLLFLGLVVSSQVTFADETSIDSLVDLLTQKGTITKEDAASFKAELAAKKDKEKQNFMVFAGRQVTITGYNQVLYKQDETAGAIDSFSIRRARLEIKGDITKQFEYDFQADFSGASAKVLDSLMAYKLNPVLKLTLGQF